MRTVPRWRRLPRRRREFGLVPGLFHERDGDRPGSGDVGEGAAVDHAHERAGHHGNLGGAASRAPYEGEREIIDKIAESAVFQEGSEEHEQENVGGGHADAHAEEPLAAPEHVLDDAVPGKPGMPERAGNPFPGEVVEENTPASAARLPTTRRAISKQMITPTEATK